MYCRYLATDQTDCAVKLRAARQTSDTHALPPSQTACGPACMFLACAVAVTCCITSPFLTRLVFIVPNVSCRASPFCST